MQFSRSAALIAALALTMPAWAQETAETQAPETAAEAETGTIEAPAEVSVDTVVATVNGTDITLGHMIAARERLPEQYQQLPDPVLFTGLLDQLVQQEALRQGREGLNRHSTLVIENETRSLQVSELIQEAVDTAITEEAIQAAYTARYAEAEPEQEFHAAHILVETEDEAKAIVEELAGGADFAETAREKSTGPSGPNGGDLGWFSKGMMVPAFEEAVVALEPGAVSEPVQTQFGWHVIKLYETRQKDAPPLEDVREEIIIQLQQETVEKVLAAATEGAEISRVENGAIDPSVLSNPDMFDE